MSLNSPLSKVIGLGSEKKGVDHWWSQRVTAVAIAILGIWLLASSAMLGDFSYKNVMFWFKQPLNTFLLILTILSVARHSHLGVESIFEDYIHNKMAKTILLVANVLLHACLAALGVFSTIALFIGA